jgi:hypothetical protein
MRQTKARQWKNMLERRISELVSLTKDICPDAEVTVRSPFETEDAVMEILVSPEKFDEVEETVGQRRTDILVEEGFHIVLLINEKNATPVI